MGIFLACPPFSVVSADEIDRVPALVSALLNRSPNTVSHPAVFNQLDTLYSLASCADWKDFSRKTFCFHVQKLGSNVIITPTQKSGAGFKHLAGAEIKCDLGNLAEQLLNVLSRSKSDS
jgi:hypothetical protein